MSHEKMIRSYDNNNVPVVGEKNDILPNTYFNLIKLPANAETSISLDKYELLFVVLSGTCDISADNELFSAVGRRKDIWSGRADSVYAGTAGQVRIKALKEDAELAIAGCICNKSFSPFRITPEEVDMVDVGSNETKSRRRIFHILGQNARDRTGNLLVSELNADEGCWSGYPPHKHDTENPPEETEFEELYHYRFNPENGFGAQFCYLNRDEPKCYMTQNGDTFTFRKGFHPTVTSPGHKSYIFTVLVGIHQRSLIQNFDKEYRYLMDKIPGISDMRSKFK
jgi:5-deoxy-glucuronate isomerase